MLSPLDGGIVLNRTEQRRVVVLHHLASGALVSAEAPELLGISKRQLQRLHKASLESGVAALRHRATLVTARPRQFGTIRGIRLEDWRAARGN